MSCYDNHDNNFIAFLLYYILHDYSYVIVFLNSGLPVHLFFSVKNLKLPPCLKYAIQINKPRLVMFLWAVICIINASQQYESKDTTRETVEK